MIGLRDLVCPVCESTQTRSFFSQSGVPTRCGYLASAREEALNSPLGDIHLQHCQSCAHIWNSAFDPEKIGFNSNYDFSQYHSPKYREYISRSIDRLKARYDLAGSTALDVACGKGEYLKMLIEAGFERAIGFDPTFDLGALDPEGAQHITVYRKLYDESDLVLKPDLVTCRSALQYVPDPRAFLHSIRRKISGKRTVAYFEVPNGAEAFHERVVWYVMYEAGCFFSAASLARLFRECGFQVLDVLPALGSSHLEIEAIASPAPTPHHSEDPDSISGISAEVDSFAAEYATQQREWSSRFETYARGGKRVVLWAAGMRAVSLLVSVPPAASHIEYVVDINPNRQGRHLPKTGQLVVSPESLLEIRPDVVIATNPNYASEIRTQLADLGLSCDFEVLR